MLPLFVLHRGFRYIIISKESLDGVAHQPFGNGALPASEKSRTWDMAGRDVISYRDGVLRHHDRRKCIYYAGSVYVPSFRRVKNSGKVL